MSEIYLFAKDPEFLSRNKDGEVIGVGAEGVEEPVDLSCHVKSVEINAPWPDEDDEA